MELHHPTQMGNHTEFGSAVQWLTDRPNLFDKDVRVNVFEVRQPPPPLLSLLARTTNPWSPLSRRPTRPARPARSPGAPVGTSMPGHRWVPKTVILAFPLAFSRGTHRATETLGASPGRCSGQRARKRPAGVPGSAWHFTGCRSCGSPHLLTTYLLTYCTHSLTYD